MMPLISYCYKPRKYVPFNTLPWLWTLTLQANLHLPFPLLIDGIEGLSSSVNVKLHKDDSFFAYRTLSAIWLD